MACIEQRKLTVGADTERQIVGSADRSCCWIDHLPLTVYKHVAPDVSFAFIEPAEDLTAGKSTGASDRGEEIGVVPASAKFLFRHQQSSVT